MKKICPSCQQIFETQFDSYDIAIFFGAAEEREYWLSGLCGDCQAQIFEESLITLRTIQN